MNRWKRGSRGLQKPSRSPYASASASSARRKFYAVRGGKGGFSGVLNSWNECQRHINGVSGVAFKSFLTYDEALAFSQNRPQAPSIGCGKKSKFYAVKYGEYSEIFTSWEECRVYVSGIRNASYKAFKSLEEALDFTGHSRQSLSRPAIVDKESNAKIGRSASTVACAEDREVIGHATNPVISDHMSSSFLVEPVQNQEQHLLVFTDGACINNGKRNSKAGYGVFFGLNSPLNISKPLPGPPTNQRAEMMAVLVAIRTVLKHSLISRGGILEIRTDSKYTKNGIDSWVAGWKKNNWKTSSGTEVKNQDLWIALDTARAELLESGVMFHLVWVKGHSGDPGNEAADELAVAGIHHM
ncbi:unnamed protein product [Chondrus crispus]|uniref:ribonuclease H n=1 Tax=Chondrus crispus TaxID=2769 RepID=R7QCR8_CHOCR|nr:unnamed protein product [Chondrus crispus]CDF35226.1 unnamed protein product [Chondrus crispus]|eukprot:XP_005715045.1 unnamed protein product [Chondrus crispus]